MERVEEGERQPLISSSQVTSDRPVFFRAVQLLLCMAFGLLVLVVVQISLVSVTKPNSLQSGNLLTQSSPNENGGEPEISLVQGRVKGTTLKSRLGRSFNAFYNLPYAEPPIGPYRFQAPRPLKSGWDGVYDARIRGNAQTECVQFKGSKVDGVEDCLKLSVFTPKLPSEADPDPKLPVMFYILGGAYLFGRSNRYKADFMMDEDVVLVFVDFRVGAFGHLNSEDGVIPGNMGFKDQVMAMRWVQENIKRFGGDPKRVLIHGNSSGAGSVHAHIISNMTKGLFHTAISQSGTVLQEPGYLTRPKTMAQNLGKSLNCPDLDNTQRLHECLLGADPRDIAEHYIQLPKSYYLSKEVIPANGDVSNVFMGEMPLVLLERGQFQKIPWMVGANSAEDFSSALKLLKNEEELNRLNNNWDEVAPKEFKFIDNENHTEARRLREFYFKDQPINNDTRYELVNLKSDTAWVHPISVAANLHAKHGGLAYGYWLTHEPVQTYAESSKEGFSPPYGVAHADEVQYLFPFDVFPYIDTQSKDFQFSQEMVKIWTEFARAGVPTVPNGVNWLPLERSYEAYPCQSYWMELNEKNYQMTDVLKYRMSFLDYFPFEDPNHEYR